jgi:hypothetical protein
MSALGPALHGRYVPFNELRAGGKTNPQEIGWDFAPPAYARRTGGARPL